MMTNRQVILDNPFHPLDLSPHDLLAVYKRFEQSRQINRNPKQQLPIQVIAQLISSLKGCPPSYIQKCMSQALIKDTISWNEFLTFLDQQSEVRQKILEWLMYEKCTIKYKQKQQLPFRAKIGKFYEEITFMKVVQSINNQKLLLCSIDKIEYILISLINGHLTIIDRYVNKTQRINQQKVQQAEEKDREKHSKMIKNESKIKKPPQLSYNIRNSHRFDKNEREKALSSMINTSYKTGGDAITFKEQDEIYYRKQRKNITSLFNIFKQLPLEEATKFSKIAAQQISQKNINSNNVSLLKDIYSSLGQQKNSEMVKKNSNKIALKPVDKARAMLAGLTKQKRILSYNPYANPKQTDQLIGQIQALKQKKLNKERKQRDYYHEANQEIYNSKLKCMCIIYFNLELALVKIVKEYNKITLEEQDKIKLLTQNQHKKNEIIQCLDFYFHSVLNKWFMLLLIRIQYKNQFRNQNQSYIKGFEIQTTQNRRRGGYDFKFKSKKETFILDLGKFQIFKMETQMQCGIHLISVNGRYFFFKQNYIEGDLKKGQQNKYFNLEHDERFKNIGLSLSCLSVGEQINKIAFGTIRGIIVVYDMFSHQFKTKKVSGSQIIQIKIQGSIAFLLTIDEKFIVYDLIKLDEIQHLNIKNEGKLHEKIKNFELFSNEVCFYGTEVRTYSQYVDEKLLHERRKMQNIYKWRLNKLLKNQKPNLEINNTLKQINKPLIKVKEKISNSNNLELMLYSQSYFILLTEILELIVIEKKNLKLKFTMILSIPHDSKVMKIAISENQKLLALLLFNQTIYIFNIHTQDCYQIIKPSPFLKYTCITFLDKKNQYLLASGTQNGKIVLSSYASIPQKSPKILEHHKKNITVVTIVKKQFLVSCGEDRIVTIWVLPFNILKHEIRMKQGLGFMMQEIGSSKQIIFIKSSNNVVIELSTTEGKISNIIKQTSDWKCGSIDSCAQELLGINKNNELEVLQKSKEGWVIKKKIKIEQREQIKFIGNVQSEKALIFFQNCSLISWNYQTQKMGKIINFSQH